MADTMTARVGVKRRGVSIYYFDCARCDDVEFEVRCVLCAVCCMLVRCVLFASIYVCMLKD